MQENNLIALFNGDFSVKSLLNNAIKNLLEIK